MKLLLCSVIVALAMTLSPGIISASGPIGVYALVDKVVLEPSADRPERIRLWGVFLVGKEQGDKYSAPQRGYLYCSLPTQNTELVRREWADLKTIAGTRQVVGMGSSWMAKVRVRKVEEEAASPDNFPLGNGLIKINSDQPRAKALLDYKDR